MKVKGYTRSDGVKVKGHKRRQKPTKKYKTVSQGVRTSSRDPKRPGKWANYHSYMRRNKLKYRK